MFTYMYKSEIHPSEKEKLIKSKAQKYFGKIIFPLVLLLTKILSNKQTKLPKLLLTYEIFNLLQLEWM